MGPRFGGALDAAAVDFSAAVDSNMSAAEFVSSMRRQNKLIMGIGHRIRSVESPDQRVVIVKEFVKEHFPASPILDFALQVCAALHLRHKFFSGVFSTTFSCLQFSLFEGGEHYDKQEE